MIDMFNKYNRTQLSLITSVTEPSLSPGILCHSNMVSTIKTTVAKLVGACTNMRAELSQDTVYKARRMNHVEV